MKHAYIGIDPGKIGGISIIGPSGIKAFKMPDTERDLWDLLESLKTWQDLPSIAMLEKVASSPQMGVVSVFTFGRGYGALRMALTGLAIPFEDILPAKWQKGLGCLTGGDKNVSKSRAQQLFPGTKWTHATSDAALIAEWNRRSNEPNSL